MGREPLVKSTCVYSLCWKSVLHGYLFSSRITKKHKSKLKEIKKEIEAIITWRKVKAFQTTIWLTAGGITFKKNGFFPCVNQRRKNSKGNSPGKKKTTKRKTSCSPRIIPARQVWTNQSKSISNSLHIYTKFHG